MKSNDLELENGLLEYQPKVGQRNSEYIQERYENMGNKSRESHTQNNHGLKNENGKRDSGNNFTMRDIPTEKEK